MWKNMVQADRPQNTL